MALFNERFPLQIHADQKRLPVLAEPPLSIESLFLPEEDVVLVCVVLLAGASPVRLNAVLLLPVFVLSLLIVVLVWDAEGLLLSGVRELSALPVLAAFNGGRLLL